MLTSCQWLVDGSTWDLLTPPPGPLGLQLLVEVQPRSCISPPRYSLSKFPTDSQTSKRRLATAPREIRLPQQTVGDRRRAAFRQQASLARLALRQPLQSPSLAVKSNTSSDPASFLSWGQSSKLNSILLSPDVLSALLKWCEATRKRRHSTRRLLKNVFHPYTISYSSLVQHKMRKLVSTWQSKTGSSCLAKEST